MLPGYPLEPLLKGLMNCVISWISASECLRTPSLQLLTDPCAVGGVIRGGVPSGEEIDKQLRISALISEGLRHVQSCEPPEFKIYAMQFS
jgi:hypothetical protein